MTEPTTNDTTVATDDTNAPRTPVVEPHTETASANETEPVGEERETHQRRRDPAADAAKYRHRLRDAESERDRIAETAKNLSAAVYGQAVQSASSKGSRLTHPDDLRLFTGKGADAYVHDGQLDHDALQADLDSLHERRPELFTRIGYAIRPDHSQGHSGAAGEAPATWRDAFSR
jgi:hypothetical protein